MSEDERLLRAIQRATNGDSRARLYVVYQERHLDQARANRRKQEVLDDEHRAIRKRALARDLGLADTIDID